MEEQTARRELQEGQRVQNGLSDLLSKVIDNGSVIDCVTQNNGIVPELQRILTFWKEDQGRQTPHVVLYLLDHTYTSDGRRVSTLKGADAQKLALLQALGTPLGFYLGVASFVGNKWQLVQGGEPDEDDIDWDESFENFLDLNGDRIHYKINPYDDERVVTLPQDYREAISAGPFVEESLMDEEVEEEVEEEEGLDEVEEEEVEVDEEEEEEEEEEVDEDEEEEEVEVEEVDENEEEEEEEEKKKKTEVKRDYHRTFLVIWPSWSNFGIRYPGRKGLKRALSKINSMTSRKGPGPDAMKLIGELLAHSHKGPKKIAGAICDLALRWNNPELWNKAIISCDVYQPPQSNFELYNSSDEDDDSDDYQSSQASYERYNSSDEDDDDFYEYPRSRKLGTGHKEDARFESDYYDVSGEGYYNTMYNTERAIPTYKIIAAVNKLGFQAILPGLEYMMEKDTFNGSKLLFLEHLEKRCDPTADDSLRPWCVAQKLRMFTSLEATERTDIRLFFAVAKAHGGIEYLKNHMLPHILAVADASVLLEFAQDLDGGRTFPPSDIKADVVSQLIRASLSKEPFYEPPDSADARANGLTETRVAQRNRTHTVVSVKFLLEMGGGHMLFDVLERIIQVNQSLNGKDAAIHTAYGMLPLVPFLEEEEEEIPRSVIDATANFETFRDKAIGLFFVHLLASPENPLLLDQLTTLVDASLAFRDGEIFVRTVWPRIRLLDIPSKYNQTLHRHISSKHERIVSVPDEKLDAHIRTEMALLSRYCAQSRTLSGIIAAMDFASKTDDSATLFEDIINRALSSITTNASYVEGTLVPLIPKLQEWALKRQTNVDRFVQKIVIVCLEQIVGPKSSADDSTLAVHLAKLAEWKCTCVSCQRARNALAQSEERTTTVRVPGMPRGMTHLCDNLAMYAAGVAEWVVVRKWKVWLDLTKSDALYELIRWRARRTKGAVLVRSLGSSEDDVRQILGSEYERVSSMVRPSLAEMEVDKVIVSPHLEGGGAVAKRPAVSAIPGFSGQWERTGEPVTKKPRY